MLKAREAQRKSYHDLVSIEAHIRTYRKTRWRKGHDIDFVDCEMRATQKQVTVNEMISDTHQGPASSQLHVSWWDVLNHVGPQNWSTKKDRINSWLLQNLAARPDEALRHRKCHQVWVSDDQFSEEEWIRLVLKFWTLDDAARPFEHGDCSTNGTVKSGCYRHSVRVMFDDESIAAGEIEVEDLSSTVSEDSETDILEEGRIAAQLGHSRLEGLRERIWDEIEADFRDRDILRICE